MQENNKPKLVLLDFDGTLMDSDIFLDFLAFRLIDYRMWWRLLLALPYIVAYKLKLMKNDEAKEKVFGAFFKGESEDYFLNSAEQFWYHHGTDINPAIVERVSDYQKEKAEFLIVSANFAPIIQSFASRNYRFDFLATEIEVVEGKLTGRFASLNCHGKEKVRRLNIRIFNRDQYSTVHAYGDSAGDLPMLRWADEGFMLSNGSWRKIR